MAKSDEILEVLSRVDAVEESRPTRVQRDNLGDLISSSYALYELAGKINSKANWSRKTASHYMDVKKDAGEIREMLPDLEAKFEEMKKVIIKLDEEE
jgi:hypothetical protein